MGKLYFEALDAEICYDLETIKDRMRYDDIKERTVFPAIVQKVEGMFWCTEYGEVTESGVSCGKQCQFYKPRNGKSGCCVSWSNLYEASEKTLTVKV